MKSILYNTGYFIREAKTIIKINLLSNILSILSTGLIFFLMAMVLSGWWISNQVVEAIQGEAEINVYFQESIGVDGAAQLVQNIKELHGVREARLVDEDEAYGRMEEILGKEAQVLEYLEDNPFNSFIEVQIYLEEIEAVVEGLSHIKGIEQIRDNREVLNHLRNATEVLKVLGYLVIAAVGLATLVIISHIIRSGIYGNREQINTLRLLGAPEVFIAFPFLIEGLILTIGGGLLALAMSVFSLKYIYSYIIGPLPFIPLPPLKNMLKSLIALLILLSSVLGFFGSLFGLASAKSD